MKKFQLTRSLCLFFAVLVLASCSSTSGLPQVNATESKANPSVRILLTKDIEWQALNPARGASSPRAATLWGDRNAEEPTGFLAKFADGFSSPPHIHNVTYRAVVIDGAIHNDDPAAASMWMRNGSFWTQPMGETHITAATGANSIALVEIDQGPYLVRPTDQAFDSGERPVNVDASNVVWLPLTQPTAQLSGAHISYLWGTFGGVDWNGSFVKLPSNFEGALITQGDVVHAVVIKGTVRFLSDGAKELTPGSYFGTRGPTKHRISSGAGSESIIYIRTNGAYRLRNND